MPQIGSKGAKLDILIRQGATFGPQLCRLTNPDNTPVNLTGSTIRCQLRKTADDPTSLGITGTIVITNALNGEFTWEFTDEQTATLIADPVSETGPDSLYVYDMEMLDTTGRIIPLLEGNVNVYRDVV